MFAGIAACSVPHHLSSDLQEHSSNTVESRLKRVISGIRRRAGPNRGAHYNSHWIDEWFSHWLPCRCPLGSYLAQFVEEGDLVGQGSRFRCPNATVLNRVTLKVMEGAAKIISPPLRDGKVVRPAGTAFSLLSRDLFPQWTSFQNSSISC